MSRQPLQDAARIGSVTKASVGTPVLQLVDQGKLALDAPVGRWLLTVPHAQQVTIRDLLGMASGLYTFEDDQQYLKKNIKYVKVQGHVATLDYRWQP
jgi:CubicO group peptidase (beta-lactamase class C family)